MFKAKPNSGLLVLRASLCLAMVMAFALPSLARQAPQNPCVNEPFRQFDFWIGDWTVTQPDGTPAGTNRIEKILNGCVLMENWSGSSGSIGKSFNQYDWQAKTWRQTWVDGAGQRLDLEGGMDGDRMVLRGERPRRRGEGTVLSEVSWTPKADGSVVQHWRSSTDGGKTWTDAFLGVYRKTVP